MRQSDSRPALRSIPSVDRVLRTKPVEDLLAAFASEPVTNLVREVLEEYRQSVIAGNEAPDAAAVGSQVQQRACDEWIVTPTHVINATGVILHTNLGRAPLSQGALDAIEASSRYSDLEYDLEEGGRASRHRQVASLLRALTGAQSAHVSVNNAAAVLLALAALARGREVLVSRGEAVEIGGGFRVPVILRQSGARLVEVGTTNRTRLSDYADAVTPRTAAILHVHPSNFRVVGFTESVSLSDLAGLARELNLHLISDNGSGAFLDTASFGLAHEPTPIEALRAGAGIVAFSADKLLGGPQAGILLGATELIRRVAGHPLARAVRPDKVTLAALSATLLPYLRGRAEEDIPVWQMIAQSSDEIEMRALRWRGRAAEVGLPVDLTPGQSTVGGGSLPGEMLPTHLLVLPKEIPARSLRRGTPPVIVREQSGRVYIDLRTVPREREDELLRAVLSQYRRDPDQRPVYAPTDSTRLPSMVQE